MYLSHLHIKNHPILKDFELDLVNPKTGKPYAVVAFVGENGCGKTTILNEIFNYNESKHITNKRMMETINVLYLRQGSLYNNAMREIRNLIDASDIHTPVNRKKYYFNPKPEKGTIINDLEQGLKIVELLGDEEICKLFKEGHIGEIYCSQDVSKVIDGIEHGYNVAYFSSGQQEILLKLKDIQTMAAGTDCVLLDEPETSLHPRWQLDIVRLMKLMTKDSYGNYPQFILATHSEKVLESLISDGDALIVRLSKDNGVIKTETISEMDLCLPSPTFAELDYIIFHIPSLSYHDELFNYFQYLIRKNSTVAVDEKIQLYGGKLFKNEMSKYEKTRIYSVHGKPYTTNTLPTYIRDFFHHPNEMKAPTSDELELSIACLRELIKYLVNRGFDNKD